MQEIVQSQRGNVMLVGRTFLACSSVTIQCDLLHTTPCEVQESLVDAHLLDGFIATWGAEEERGEEKDEERGLNMMKRGRKMKGTEYEGRMMGVV
jgi:hypothetical protein